MKTINKVVITMVSVYSTRSKYILNIIQMIANTRYHDDINGFITALSLQIFREVFKTFRNSFSNFKPENII